MVCPPHVGRVFYLKSRVSLGFDFFTSHHLYAIIYNSTVQQKRPLKNQGGDRSIRRCLQITLTLRVFIYSLHPLIDDVYDKEFS
jgi:hypothetical protein